MRRHTLPAIVDYMKTCKAADVLAAVDIGTGQYTYA